MPLGKHHVFRFLLVNLDFCFCQCKDPGMRIVAYSFCRHGCWLVGIDVWQV